MTIYLKRGPGEFIRKGTHRGVEYVVKVQNIVVTGKLYDINGEPVSLNIRSIGDLFISDASSVELGTERRFPALILKFEALIEFPDLERPVRRNISVLVFDTGKIVVAGSPSIQVAVFFAELVARRLAGLGVGKVEVTPVNVVTSAHLVGVRVNLERIAYKKELWYPIYEPDDFPAAIAKVPREVIDEMGDPVKVLIYGNGKLIVPGVKSVGEAEKVVKVVIERIVDLGALLPAR